jgi:DNA-binding transcriptional MerR regulator
MTEYRIDDLAQRAGTTVRNVRAYQERGLLAPPRRQGRAGVFDDEHLRRLRMIGRLLERGYTLANIGELLDAWEKGRAIDEVLGADEVIPPRVTVAWLVDAFVGTPGERDPDDSDDPGPGAAAPTASGHEAAALQAAFDLGVLDPVVDHDGFRVTNPRLLQVAVELARAGIPLPALARLARELRRNLDRVAHGIVDLIDTHLFVPLGDDLPTPAEAARLSQLAWRLRPLADAVVVGELDRAINDLVRQRLDERLPRLLGPPEPPAPTEPRAT